LHDVRPISIRESASAKQHSQISSRKTASLSGANALESKGATAMNISACEEYLGLVNQTVYVNRPNL
jgi:hypothetical protein